MNLTIKEDGDFVRYVGIVSKEYDRFKLNELISDMLKELIIIPDLTAKKDVDICAIIAEIE